jgi:hypothetical protein
LDERLAKADDLSEPTATQQLFAPDPLGTVPIVGADSIDYKDVAGLVRAVYPD